MVNVSRMDYTFTADSESMEVQIAFTFDASELGGKELVTFEELYDLSNPDEPTKVTEHKDIEDDGQTVTITEVPENARRTNRARTADHTRYTGARQQTLQRQAIIQTLPYS